MLRASESTPAASGRILRRWIAIALLLSVGGAVAAAGPLPFLPGTQIGALASATAVVTGDFNRDGRLDLAAASYLDDEVRWFESTDSGFVEHPVSSAFSGPVDLASGDIDCDGDLDLVIAVYGADRVVWARNLGGGGWNLGGTVTNAAPNVLSVAVLDLEPDGDLDVVGAVPGSNEIVRWRSDGCSGTVWTATTLAGGLDTPERVATGDVNGDGLADVVGVDVVLDLLAYWENPGNAGAWTQVTIDAGWSGGYSVSLGDLDGDGDLDVVSAAGLAGDEIAWWENPGAAGAWAKHPVADLSDAFAVRTTDLDRDGDLDLLAGSYAATVAPGWWENVAGDGGEWAYQALDAPEDISDLIAGDFDGDGDADVAIATDSAGVRHVENESTRGSALFSPQDDWAANATFEIVDAATGDLDGDGRLDVVFAERDEPNGFGHVSWYRNLGPVPAGGSSFAFANLAMVAIGEVESVAVGDIDEDGDQDLIVGSRNSALSAWFCRNEGAGASWALFPNILPPSLPQVDALELADIDGDSDLDLLSAVVEGALGPLTAIWWENPVDSTGSWARHDLGALAEFPNELRAVDVNGDGDLDVLSGSEHWWRNDGGSPPVWTARTLPGSSPGSIEVGDLDGDGDTDFAFVGRLLSAGWYENNSNAPGAVWIEHDILLSVGVPSYDFGVALADFDLDGDLDIAAGVETSPGVEHVSWIENELGTWMETPIALPGSLRNSQIVAGDFHRDGAADLLVVQRASSAWDLFWNGGGQFAVATTDIAASTLPEGGEGALFSLELHHRGRAGDRDIELASLSLLFESAPGTPLTTDELAAVVSSFALYRDDGSGIFEPGVDTPVVAFGPRPLTAGLGSFSLADDLVDLRLAVAESPVLFFLTLEAAPDALDSGISTLVVTHFERDGSFAENADFDTPLRAEHAEYAGSSAAEIAILSPSIFADGFESQGTSAWSFAVP